MIKTNRIGIVDYGDGGALVLKKECEGFLSKNNYATINMYQQNIKNFLDMINGKENYFNDSLKSFLELTNEKVNEVKIYSDATGNYISDLKLGKNNIYYNVQPSIAMILGLMGNSDILVDEKILIDEKKAKINLGLLPDIKFLDRNDCKKVKKSDDYKKIKKSNLEEIIKFTDIKDFKYSMKPKHVLSKENYQKMEFKKDEDVKKSFKIPMGTAIIIGMAEGITSKFSLEGKDYVLPRKREEDFELKSCYNAQEKRHDIHSLLNQIFKDYKIEVSEIYFETEIDKYNNDREIFIDPKNAFVNLSKGDKFKTIYVDNHLPLFLHFSRNVSIKINEGKDTISSPYG